MCVLGIIQHGWTENIGTVYYLLFKVSNGQIAGVNDYDKDC